MSNARELAELSGSYGTGGFVGMKNRIINGDMKIAQRGTSAVTTNAAYPVDRFYQVMSSGVISSVQSSTAPAGFTNSIASTVSTADATLGAGAQYCLRQVIEGLNLSDLAWGTASAAPITVSFWVRASVTGSYPLSLRNSATDRSYVGSYTINAANTWEYKTITIAGDQTGTWLTTNGVGIYLQWGLGNNTSYNTTAGAWTSGNYFSFTGAANWISTAGATFNITGVQLEKGSTATSFDYRPYGTELALCQRYYNRITAGAIAVGLGGVGAFGSSTTGQLLFQYPVVMRAAPTFNHSNAYLANGVSASPVTSISAVYAGVSSAQVTAVASALSVSAGQGCYFYAGNNTAAYSEFTAEL